MKNEILKKALKTVTASNESRFAVPLKDIEVSIDHEYFDKLLELEPNENRWHEEVKASGNFIWSIRLEEERTGPEGFFINVPPQTINLDVAYSEGSEELTRVSLPVEIKEVSLELTSSPVVRLTNNFISFGLQPSEIQFDEAATLVSFK